jgi:RHS repeat-associated protein
LICGITTYTYDAFGNIVSQIGSLTNPYTYTGREYDPESGLNPYTYTGREYDPESGLYYYRARYYDPEIGRFLQPDPLDMAMVILIRQYYPGNLISELLYHSSLGNPMTMSNVYPYVGNNPVNWVDALGLKWSLGSSFGFLIIDYGWDTSDPGKGQLDMPIGSLGGAGWHVTWTSDTGKGSPAANGEVIAMPIVWNVGLGKYLGVSFADDLSSFSFNIGMGLAFPFTPSLPIEGDFSFGGWLYDLLHPSDDKCN